MFVQFSDAAEQQIVAVFSCEQDADAYPYQGRVDVADARYSAYYNSLCEESRSGLPVPAASVTQ